MFDLNRWTFNVDRDEYTLTGVRDDERSLHIDFSFALEPDGAHGSPPPAGWDAWSDEGIEAVHGWAERTASGCYPRRGVGSATPCTDCKVARTLALASARALAYRHNEALDEARTALFAEPEAPAGSDDMRALRADRDRLAEELRQMTESRDAKQAEIDRQVRKVAALEEKSINFGCSIHTASVLLNVCDEEARNMARGDFDMEDFRATLEEGLARIGYTRTRTYEVEVSGSVPAFFTVTVEAESEDAAHDAALEMWDNASAWDRRDMAESGVDISDMDGLEILDIREEG